MTSAVPRAFHCEHTRAKSRVYALVERSGQPTTLHAVLTCTDPVVAQHAAHLLSSALENGLGPAARAASERIAAALPDAPAASFRRTLADAVNGTWHDAPELAATWESLRRGRGESAGFGDDLESRTPGDARLEAFPGPVVRTISLLEVHVHDPARLLAAATATGWRPFDAEDLDEDDRQDVVGAVMHFVNGPEFLPGADPLMDATQARLLRADRGDEVSDWSPAPVTARFDTGTRSGPDEWAG
ncbi:hypothetical protein ACIBKY_10880 [Nonomuraea sp. NPDC050394]|uniref:hypothetical protein n=1 Tax=Nonomuraea sp. NPDC050394 TaxID=3364363 RepID=UPI0037BDA9B1